MTTTETRKAYRRARTEAPRGRAIVALEKAHQRLAAVAEARAVYLAENPRTGDPEARGGLPIDSAEGVKARAAYTKAKARAGLYDSDGPAPRWPSATMSEDGTAIHVMAPDCVGAFGRVNNAKAHWQGAASWFDNPHGESARDGSGLCWGVVALLSHGRALAGWQFGGTDGGPTLSTRIFTGPDYLEDAARYADGLAERAAEDEREYRAAYDAGARWAELGAEITEARAAALALLAERRTLRGRVDCEAWPGMVRAIRDSVAGWVRDIAEARAERAELALTFDHVDGWAEGAGV